MLNYKMRLVKTTEYTGRMLLLRIISIKRLNISIKCILKILTLEMKKYMFMHAL